MWSPAVFGSLRLASPTIENRLCVRELEADKAIRGSVTGKVVVRNDVIPRSEDNPTESGVLY
jgi:hypothetical protein